MDGSSLECPAGRAKNNRMRRVSLGSSYRVILPVNARWLDLGKGDTAMNSHALVLSGRCAPFQRRLVLCGLLTALLFVVCRMAFGQTFTTLHTFTGTDGALPIGKLIQGQDGYLYGTTLGAGPTQFGTIFKMRPDGSGFTTLYLMPGNLGNSLSGLTQGPDGSLYGTTLFGGASGFAGAVFKAQPDGSGIVNLYSFMGGSDGGNPLSAPVPGGDGYVYGVAPLFGSASNGSGSYGNGVVYKLATDGSSFSVLYTFSGSDGQAPYGGLILGNDGLLYGTTAGGGIDNAGTVFRISRDGATFQQLHVFTGPDGFELFAGLIQGSDGLLYGTTISGGSTGGGTIFKLGTDGTGFAVLGEFDNKPGFTFLGGQQVPWSTIVEGPDGNLYGSSLTGGANGSLYRVARDGSGFTTLYSFSALDSSNINIDGGYPLATLIASDGSLYGTTSYGSASGFGSIFKLSLFTYTWSGYLQPINTDGSSIFKLGRTVPVKFQLTGTSAEITNAVARLTIAQVSNNVIGTYMEASSTSAADSGNQFRYDPTSGQYIFNLGTSGLSTGTYELNVDLGDGVQNRTVLISLK